MMGPTHALVGGTTAFVAATAVGLPVELVCVSIVVATATSSAPDNAEKLLPLGHHRRITHYPSVQVAFACLLGASAVAWLPGYGSIIWLVAASLALGCVMHSVADAMTVDKNGIRLLWPISRRGYHLLPWPMRVWVGSKSRSEKLFAATWVAFVLIYTYAHFSSLIPA